jgi:hypothetical protein
VNDIRNFIPDLQTNKLNQLLNGKHQDVGIKLEGEKKSLGGIQIDGVHVMQLSFAL